ncbi:MAG TPA: hypothetical protein VIS51_10095, partial [Solirubrobacterales bacterium]
AWERDYDPYEDEIADAANSHGQPFEDDASDIFDGTATGFGQRADRLLAHGNPGLHMHPRTAQQAHSDAVLVGDEREAYAIGGWAAAVGLTWPGHHAHPQVPDAWVESTRLWNTMLEQGLAPLDSDDVPF